MAFEVRPKASLPELTIDELRELYADMRARLASRYPDVPSWFDGPPACTCERAYHNGAIRSYRYLPTCKRCPDKLK